ncbi:MAG: GGDEF domain-containing protein [Alphaproteobacteria bacterium]|nr:MAG: GGDEF domain-containing protein [Alphaproteobacteria bacterium]
MDWMTGGNIWLVAANLFLGLLLVFWMWRCRELVARARRTRDRYRATIENLAEGIYQRSCTTGRMVSANTSLARICGLRTSAELLAAVNCGRQTWYVEPGRHDAFMRRLLRDGAVSNFVSEVHRHDTGKPIWVTESARIVRDERTGRPLFYEGSVRDITELVRHNQLEERLEKLADNLPGGLFQLVRRPDGRFACPYVSTSFVTLLGLERPTDEIRVNDYLRHVHGEDLAGYLAALDRSARQMTFWAHEFRYIRDPSTTMWLLVTATPEKLADGSIIWHGYVCDVSQRKIAEQQIHKLAYYDPLTDLPNRRLFTQRLEEAIAANRRRDEHGAVLFIDIDNFKTLNDTQGHEMGDLLLAQVALRLRECVRERDTVGRFGGDEFVLLLDGLGADRADAIANATGAANKILREFDRGFNLAGMLHSATPSIGIVVFDGDSHTTAEIIKGADIAMYEAKKSGRNNYAVFDPASLKSVADVYSLQRELGAAIRRRELFFEFQPVVEADGRVVGAEALMRWNHPQRGILAPGEFVPMAEMTGLIMDISEWALDQAVATLADWRQRPALQGISLAVNISVQQFRSDEFVERMRRRIAESGIDPARLTLELTEHVMARDPETVARRMEALKQIGLRFSLDDFGTGYSSLSQLNRFPFDEVKIDGAFVSDIEHRAQNRTLIEAILGMARALGLDTVAEHVGSPYQVEFLEARGCMRFQGFYYHPPISIAALVDLVDAQQPRLRVVNA